MTTMKWQVNAAESPVPSGRYSQAVVANGLLFLAGVGPHDPETREIVGSTIEEQTVQTIKNVRAVLRAAGCDLQHVVNTTAYLADLERDWAAFDATYGSFFTPPYPARTTIGASLKRMLLELTVVATLSPDAQDRGAPPEHVGLEGHAKDTVTSDGRRAAK